MDNFFRKIISLFLIQAFCLSNVCLAETFSPDTPGVDKLSPQVMISQAAFKSAFFLQENERVPLRSCLNDYDPAVFVDDRGSLSVTGRVFVEFAMILHQLSNDLIPVVSAVAAVDKRERETISPEDLELINTMTKDLRRFYTHLETAFGRGNLPDRKTAADMIMQANALGMLVVPLKNLAASGRMGKDYSLILRRGIACIEFISGHTNTVLLGVKEENFDITELFAKERKFRMLESGGLFVTNIFGYRDGLNFVIRNLRYNVIDHAGGFSTNYSVALSQDEKDIIIIFADRGGGFDLEMLRNKAVELGVWSRKQAESADEAEVIDMIFRKGFSRRYEEGKSHGLGLWLCRQIVERYFRGSISARNAEQGKGAVFTLRIPLPKQKKIIPLLSALIGPGKGKQPFDLRMFLSDYARENFSWLWPVKLAAAAFHAVVFPSAIEKRLKFFGLDINENEVLKKLPLVKNTAAEVKVFGRQLRVNKAAFKAVRLARPGDSETIAALSRRLFDEGVTAYEDLLTGEEILELLDDDEHLFLVLEEKGKVRGFAYSVISGDRAVNEQLVVGRESENNGYARALAVRRLAELEKRGVDYIETIPTNPKTRKMIESLGLFDYKGELLYVMDKTGGMLPDKKAWVNVLKQAECRVNVLSQNGVEAKMSELPVVRANKLPAYTKARLALSFDRWLSYTGEPSAAHINQIGVYRACLEWNSSLPDSFYAVISYSPENGIEIEGFLDTEVGREINFVRAFMETAPWNRYRDHRKRRYQGVGQELRAFGMKTIIREDPLMLRSATFTKLKVLGNRDMNHDVFSEQITPRIVRERLIEQKRKRDQSIREFGAGEVDDPRCSLYLEQAI